MRRAPRVLTARARAVAHRVSGDRTMSKLAVFVGVPLPGSGAWTGALVAAVLGMPVRQGVQALCVGGVVAAGIVTGVCSLGWIGGVMTGVVAIAVMGVRIVRATRNEMEKRKQKEKEEQEGEEDQEEEEEKQR